MANDSEFQRETSRLATAWADEVAKYDRTLLTLATGSLALSVALVRDMHSEVMRAEVLLLGGWISLLASLALVIWSYVISKEAIEARWDHDHETGDVKSAEAWSRSKAAGWFLVSGALALVIFAWINVI